MEVANQVKTDTADPLLVSRVRAIADDIDLAWRESVGVRFDVLLESYTPDRKVSTIIAVRLVAGLGLAESKSLVEGPLPGVVLRGLLLEQAEQSCCILERGERVRLPDHQKICSASLRVATSA